MIYKAEKGTSRKGDGSIYFAISRKGDGSIYFAIYLAEKGTVLFILLFILRDEQRKIVFPSRFSEKIEPSPFLSVSPAAAAPSNAVESR
jgi:hypothetical protein